MGFADKVQSKLSSNKQYSDADKAGGKAIGKENVSGEVIDQYNQGNINKENAIKYGDQYDKQAGKAVGRENLSGTESGAGTKFFGGKSAAPGADTSTGIPGAGTGSGTAGSGGYSSQGPNSASGHGTSDSYGTSGKDAYTSSTTDPGIDPKFKTTTGYDKEKTSSEFASGSAFGPAGQTSAHGEGLYHPAEVVNAANNKQTASYGQTNQSDQHGVGAGVAGAAGGGTAGAAAGTVYEKKHGSSNYSNSGQDSSYGSPGHGTTAHESTVHKTSSHPAAGPGYVNSASKEHGNSASSGSHGVSGGQAGTAAGLGAGAGAAGAAGAHSSGRQGQYSGDEISKSGLGGFTTGDKSLDSKIAALDSKGQAKAKEAFEKGYNDAIKAQK